MANKERKGHFFHVIHDKTDNQWNVQEVKGTDIIIFKTKEEAIKKAEEIAKKVEMGHVVVHNEKGIFETFEHFSVK